jgi:hypothetical protein
MKKPMSLQEFADQHKENYDLIKEVVILYNEISHYQHETLCAVCDKELTAEEINSLQPSHYYFCCFEHAEYRGCYTIAPIRKKLGFSERLYLNID